MKLIISILLGMFLMLSPAMAAENECISMDTMVTKISKQDHMKVVQYTDKKLAQLNHVAEKHGAVPPAGQDGLLIIMPDNQPMFAGVVFVKGCATQVFPISPTTYEHLIAEMAEMKDDDGSI